MKKHILSAIKIGLAGLILFAMLLSVVACASKTDDRISELEKTVADLTAELDGVKGEAADQSDKLSTANAELEALKAKLEEVETNLDASDENVSTLTDELAAEKEKVASLEASLVEAQEKVAILEAALTEADGDITALEAELASANATVATLESAFEEASTKAVELEAYIEELLEAKASLEEVLAAADDRIAELEAEIEKLSATVYDFYITLGTMPTLYATLNAYAEKNPNTYMWFYRGNTISYEFTADHISYFETQSTTNANSGINYELIRQKIKDIKASDPNARFRLFCDDLRVSFILMFATCGVAFEDLDVTLLSDGTATYSYFKSLSENEYKSQAEKWEKELNNFTNKGDNANFDFLYGNGTENNGQATAYFSFAYYLTTFDNVRLWVQHPEYMKNSSEHIMAAKETMNIIEKNPTEMYELLPNKTREEYQMAVLANALVDNDELTTLEDAAQYFNSKLANRDKDVVLILGTSYNTEAANQPYLDKTVEFYTPTRDATDATKVTYKGVTYTVAEDATTIEIDGRALVIGELGVYLFFKGHPAYPAKDDLLAYFTENGVEVLPHRTPVETLFWMYDVKAGGYNSTSFLSCYKGQTEFFYGNPSGAVADMQADGFFDGAVTFTAE